MKRPICILLIILLMGYSILPAQSIGGQSNRSSAAQYYLGEDDELLVPVNIWGFVRLPGQYFVPNNTNLIALLSFAGGPSEDAKISNIRIIRNDLKQGSSVWRVDVKKYLESGDERLIPMLRPGDTIIVSGTTFHWISRFFEFVARLATIAQIFYFVAIAQNALKK
jgi:polysaccharide export outer membrane protein